MIVQIVQEVLDPFDVEMILEPDGEAFRIPPGAIRWAAPSADGPAELLRCTGIRPGRDAQTSPGPR